MSIHAYHEIYLHLTWHTKHNQPILTPEIEDRLHHYLVHRSCESPGVFIYEIGGTKDHLHLAVRVPPTLLLCKRNDYPTARGDRLVARPPGAKAPVEEPCGKGPWNGPRGEGISFALPARR